MPGLKDVERLLARVICAAGGVAAAWFVPRLALDLERPEHEALLRESVTGIAGFAVGWIALCLLGPQRTLAFLRRAAAGVPLRPALAVGALALMTPLFAVPTEHAGLSFLAAYLATLAGSAAGVLGLAAAADRLDPRGRGFRAVARFHPAGLAVLFGFAAVGVFAFAFTGLAWVNDEAAQSFQARLLADGALYAPAPPFPDAFKADHVFIDGGSWYGIFPPGWPAALALGHAAGLPWIVGPFAGVLALLAGWRFFREAGYGLRETRLALVLLACSPFLVMLSASYMSHAWTLALLLLFAWMMVRVTKTGRLRYGAAAGLALGAAVLARPLDALAFSAPFGVYWLARAVRERRGLLNAVPLAGLPLLACALILATNETLTGDAFVFPASKYFEAQGAGEFGLGFGPDMGTRHHGKQFPGFMPWDGATVSSLRLAWLLESFHGVLAWRQRRGHAWHAVLLAAGASVAFAYYFHFYHGNRPFGGRHYTLATPVLVIALGRAFAQRTREEHDRAPARAVLLGVLVFSVAVAQVRPVLRRQRRDLRPEIATVTRDLDRALVFVRGSWRVAFQLNRLPLESNDVLFAQDLGARNRRLVERFPDRTPYLCTAPERGPVRLHRLGDTTGR